MNPVPVRVLLVEDSDSDADLLRESLADSALERLDIVQAACWAEAEEKLRGDGFDLLLLDLSLPDSQGRETFVRAHAAAPDLPIVVLTGITDEVIAIDALRHGIQDYLVKGQTDGRQTARAIRYAIERGRTENALKQAQAALRQSERQLRDANLELERRVVARTAQLEEMIANLEDFSHSITHDLRGPLRAMRAFAQFLGEECGMCCRPAAQDYTQRIINAAGRMDKLILDVLQYSRTSRGELTLVPVDTTALLRGIIESYPAFHAPQVDIQIQDPLPPVLGNEAVLTQCFSNFLSNAVKFVAPGIHPQIRIWADLRPAGVAPGPLSPTANILAVGANRPPMARFWFADNGIGIAKEMHERIFELFHRLNRNYDGTGVGLAVVRKAAERMGGKVGLESEPGQGSRFWLELTAAPPSTSRTQ